MLNSSNEEQAPLIQDGQFIEGLASVSAVQTEAPVDAVAVITDLLTAGAKIFTDFASARLTVIRGYFDEIFAKKSHAEQICLKKSDGSEVCVTGDQLQNIINGNTSGNSAAPTSVSTNESVDSSTGGELVSDDSPSNTNVSDTSVANESTPDPEPSMLEPNIEVTPSTADDGASDDVPAQ